MAQLTENEIAIYKDWAQIVPRDPWVWLKYFTFTKDEHDDRYLYKPFPPKLCYRIICRAIQEFDVLFMEKSRQMMISWIFCSLFLHDALFRNNRRIFYQTEKDEKAQALIDRSRHIYTGCLNMTGDFLGNWLPEIRMTGKKAGTNSELAMDSMGSSINAIPQGPEQIPSYTLSWLFADEIDLQPKFEKGYAAAAPAIHGGGGFVGTGSVYGQSFGESVMYCLDPQTRKPLGEHKIDSRRQARNFVKPPGHYNKVQERYWIENKLVNMPTDQFMKVPFEDLVACVPGIDYWKTADDFDVLKFHYSADPKKDPMTPEGKIWCKGLRKIFKTESAWDQHMEMRRDVFAGRPVVRNWETLRFVKDLREEYDSHLPIGLSFDFGTQCCLCFFSQYRPVIIDKTHIGYQELILKELVLLNSDTPTLADETVRIMRDYFPRSWLNKNIRACCDPNGWQHSATTSDRSMSTSVGILNAHGIYPRNKKFGCRESTELIETVFEIALDDGSPRGLPAILIDQSCEYLISCCAGGLHYPEIGTGIEGHYEKDGKFDHGGDGLRYRLANDFTQYDLTGKGRPYYNQPQTIHDGTTGRIIGHVDKPRNGHGQYSHRLQGGQSA